MRRLTLLLVLALACPLLAQPVGARNKFKLGRGSFQRGEYPKAVEYFEATLKEDSGYLDAHYLLGLTYLALENFPKAEEKLGYVIVLDSSFLPAYQYLGQTFVAQKKFSQARATFQQLAQVPGGAATSHYCLGVVDYQEKNLASAEQHWSFAARLDPKDARSRNNLGILRSNAGQPGQALIHFQAAVKLSPDNPAYLLNQALALISLQQIELARQQLVRVAKLSDQRHDVGFLGQAVLASLDGRWEAVLNHTQSCLKRNPEFTQAWLLQGQALERLQRQAEARQAFLEALRTDPNLAEAEKALQRLPEPAPETPHAP